MSLPILPTQLTFVLVHESAHAMMAAHFFGPCVVKSIRYGALRTNGGNPAVGLTTFAMTIPQLHRRDPVGSAIVHLAGCEAERMAGSGSKWDACSDLESAADACDVITRRTGKVADYRELFSETRRLLIKYWRQIETISEALVASDDAELRGPGLQRLLAIE